MSTSFARGTPSLVLGRFFPHGVVFLLVMSFAASKQAGIPSCERYVENQVDSGTHLTAICSRNFSGELVSENGDSLYVINVHFRLSYSYLDVYDKRLVAKLHVFLNPTPCAGRESCKVHISTADSTNPIEKNVADLRWISHGGLRSRQPYQWAEIDVTTMVTRSLALLRTFPNVEQRPFSLTLSFEQAKVQPNKRTARRAKYLPFLSMKHETDLQTKHESSVMTLKHDSFHNRVKLDLSQRARRSVSSNNDKPCRKTSRLDDGSFFLPRETVEFVVEVPVAGLPQKQTTTPISSNSVEPFSNGNQASTEQSPYGHQSTHVTSSTSPSNITRSVVYVLPKSIPAGGLIVHRCSGSCDSRQSQLPIHEQTLNYFADLAVEEGGGPSAARDQGRCTAVRFRDDPSVSVQAKDDPDVYKRIVLKSLHAEECKCTVHGCQGTAE